MLILGNNVQCLLGSLRFLKVFWDPKSFFASYRTFLVEFIGDSGHLQLGWATDEFRAPYEGVAGIWHLFLGSDVTAFDKPKRPLKRPVRQLQAAKDPEETTRPKKLNWSLCAIWWPLDWRRAPRWTRKDVPATKLPSLKSVEICRLLKPGHHQVQQPNGSASGCWNPLASSWINNETTFWIWSIECID